MDTSTWMRTWVLRMMLSEYLCILWVTFECFSQFYQSKQLWTQWHMFFLFSRDVSTYLPDTSNNSNHFDQNLITNNIFLSIRSFHYLQTYTNITGIKSDLIQSNTSYHTVRALTGKEVLTKQSPPEVLKRRPIYSHELRAEAKEEKEHYM